MATLLMYSDPPPHALGLLLRQLIAGHRERWYCDRKQEPNAFACAWLAMPDMLLLPYL